MFAQGTEPLVSNSKVPEAIGPGCKEARNARLTQGKNPQFSVWGSESRVWFPYRYKCIEIRTEARVSIHRSVAEPSATQVALGTMWDDGSWQSLGSRSFHEDGGRDAGGARRLDDGFTHGLYWLRWSRFAYRGI